MLSLWRFKPWIEMNLVCEFGPKDSKKSTRREGKKGNLHKVKCHLKIDKWHNHQVFNIPDAFL